MVLCKLIRNILRREIETWNARPGRPVIEYAPRGFDPTSGHIELNGKRLDQESVQKEYATEGDEIYFAVVPHGPAIGFALAAAYSLAVAAPALVFGASLIGVAIGLQYALAPDMPRAPSEKVDRAGFTGVQTTVGTGHVIPLILGEVRAGGHIIESFILPKFTFVPPSDPFVTTIAEQNWVGTEQYTLYTRIAYCHGPIESISEEEIDDTSIDDIAGVSYESVLGTNIQKPLEFMDKVGSQNQSDVSSGELEYGVAYVEPTSIAVDQVAILITFDIDPGLGETNNEMVLEKSVDIILEYRITDSGDSYTPYDTVTFTGETLGPTEFWVLFPRFDTRDFYDIRVTRDTADSTGDVHDKCQFKTMLEMRAGRFAHPGIAQVAYTQIPHESQGVPTKYSALVKGSNDIRIYTDSSTYTTAWTDNPAWCALYLIMHPRCGMGHFFTYEDSIRDMNEFIAAADWCDELVDDGQGSTEKRATFNHCFDQPISRSDIIQLFYNSCGLILIEEAGKWRVVVDDDSSIVRKFSQAVIKKDSLTWGWAGTHERVTRMVGNFANVDRDYEIESYPRIDSTLSAGEHAVEKSVDMFGATGRAQVARRLIKMLRANRLNNRVVRFTAGYMAFGLQAGDVFAIATLTGGIGIGNGLVRGILNSGTYIYLDQDVTLEYGTSYEITIAKDPGKTIETQNLVVLRSETTDIVQVASPNPWTEKPTAGDQWSIGLVNYSYKKFRCMGKKVNDKLESEITALSHDPDVYDFDYTVDPDPLSLTGPFYGQEPIYYDPYAVPSIVRSLTLEQVEHWSSDEGLFVSWLPPETGVVDHYEVWIAQTNAPSRIYYKRETTKNVSIILGPVQALITVRVRVIAVSPEGKKLAFDNAATDTLTIS